MKTNKKNTRNVYKTKGTTHVCFAGQCFAPKDELTEFSRGDKVKVKLTESGVEVFRPVPKKKGVREQWVAVKPTWRPAKEEESNVVQMTKAA